MKVVLFCGGMGMRLRDCSEQIPKPLVEVGQRPILWHLMKYYAHHGHKEFILCLGHGARKIKEYFLNYDECDSNDFVFATVDADLELLSTDIDDWKITFVDTARARTSASASDECSRTSAATRCSSPTTPTGSTDLPLDTIRRAFLERDVKAASSPCRLRTRSTSCTPMRTIYVDRLEHVGQSPVRINAGYFVLRREIFDYLRPAKSSCSSRSNG